MNLLSNVDHSFSFLPEIDKELEFPLSEHIAFIVEEAGHVLRQQFCTSSSGEDRD